jgi:hypothetical protein
VRSPSDSPPESNVKYGHYGMTATAESYRSGSCVLRADRAMAWNDFPNDVTRFVFVE